MLTTGPAVEKEHTIEVRDFYKRGKAFGYVPHADKDELARSVLIGKLDRVAVRVYLDKRPDFSDGETFYFMLLNMTPRAYTRLRNSVSGIISVKTNQGLPDRKGYYIDKGAATSLVWDLWLPNPPQLLKWGDWNTLEIHNESSHDLIAKTIEYLAVYRTI